MLYTNPVPASTHSPIHDKPCAAQEPKGRCADHSHIEILIPIRVQRLFDHARRMRLFPIDGDDGEWIGQAEYVPLDEGVGGDDWEGGRGVSG